MSKPKQTIFNHHSDPGHGWVAVKKSLIKELGLVDKITRFSYINGQSVYLDEDQDYTAFFKAFTARFGIEPTTRTLVPRNSSSPIRSMKRYSIGGF